MAIVQTFTQSQIAGISVSNPTSLQVGSDGRLYVLQQNGPIKSFALTRDGSGWTASDPESVVFAKPAAMAGGLWRRPSQKPLSEPVRL